MRVLIFTSNYPTGFGESYLNYEIPVLLKYYDCISIFSIEKKKEIQVGFQTIKDLVPVRFLSSSDYSRKIKIVDKVFIFKCLFMEFIHCKQKMIFIKRFRQLYAKMKQALLMAGELEGEIKGDDEILYSFWMNEWALALAILKKKGVINSFVFRVNGYDIYDDRHEGNYLPFRYFIYSQCSKIFAVSKTAADYIKKLGYFQSKISFSYFGTPDFGFVEPKKRVEFVVFSCSSVIDVKRVDKIAQVILELDIPVKWVHHGEGPKMEQVNSILKNAPENLTFINTPNNENLEELKTFERDLAADVFINLSSTEGLPVTAIEAMSFGCTLLLNDAGSSAELINSLTGILVDVNESPASIAKKMKELFISGQTYKNRTAIRNYWKNHFSDKENYGKFADQLRESYSQK